MERFVLNHLLLKEKLAFILCIILATLILITGIYDFLIVEFIARELVMTIGVFFILLSVGLMPRMFFSPLTSILKSESIPTIGNPRVQQWLLLSGVFIFLLGLIWRLLL